MQCRRPGFNPWVRRIPQRRARQPTTVFLPEKCHGQRSLASYGQLQSTGSQRVGHTQWLTLPLSVSVINTSLSSPWNLDSYLAHKQPQGGKHVFQCGGWLVDLEKEHVGVKDPFHHWILTFRLLELSLEIQHSTYLGWVKGHLCSFKKYFLWTCYEMVR